MHISNQDQVAHAVISVQRNIGEEVWRPNSRKRATVMPKRYLPYQISNGKPSQNTKKNIVVINNGPKKVPNVQKEVGTVFLHQGEEQVVDVETVGSEEPSFVLDSKVQAITQKPAVVKQEVVEEDIKKPSCQAVEIKTTEVGCSPVSGSVKQLSTPAKSPAKQPPPPGQANTIAFVNVLLHALKCPLGGPCDKPACRKMKMVLQHYKHCAFKRKSQLGSEESLVKQDCKVCGQLIRIVALHSKTDCKVTADIGCPVLMCDTFRMVAKRNRVAKVNETSSRVPASSAIRRAGPKAAQPVSSS